MSTIILIIVSLAVYFAPTIVALRRYNHTPAIFALNLFLGWTLIGWVAALVLALWQNNAHTNGAPA